MSQIVVAALGNIVADLAVRGLDKLPRWGQSWFVNEPIDVRVGGNGAIFAQAYARLGAPVRLFGQVGRDIFGTSLLRRLQRAGVDITGVKRTSRASTALTVALVHRSGERSFLHHGGASFTLTARDLDVVQLTEARHLHYGGYYYLPRLQGRPARRVLKEAQHRGLTTSLDTGWDPSGRWLRALDDCLAYVDVFLPNEVEAEHLARRGNARANASFLLSHGPGVVAIKLGAGGCLVATLQARRHLPAFQVRARDATGAGDVFNAAFLYGHLRGLTPEQAGQLANAYGALRVSLHDDGVHGPADLKSFAAGARSRKRGRS